MIFFQQEIFSTWKLFNSIYFITYFFSTLGAPMGLPQNAIVVTMEMGNILYQGVLFGQLKR